MVTGPNNSFIEKIMFAISKALRMEAKRDETLRRRARKSEGRSKLCTLLTICLTAELHWQSEKHKRIEQALSSDPIDLSALKELSWSFGGLLDKQTRKRVWPKLLGVNVFYIYPYEGPPLSGHKERPQVLLDIHRCGKRIPPGKATPALMLSAKTPL